MGLQSDRYPSFISGRENHNPKTPDSRRRFSNDSIAGRSSASSLPRAFNPGSAAPSPSSNHDLAGSRIRTLAEKENEKGRSGSNPVRCKSPVVVPRGVKSFMAPTISAASKKKVLSERNDGDVSISGLASDRQWETGLDSQVQQASPHNFSIVDAAGNEKELLLSSICSSAASGITSLPSVGPFELTQVGDMGQKIATLPDSEVTSETQKASEIPHMPESVIENVHFHSAPVLECSNTSLSAPSDAHSSLPPYDPKTNYLSPRPRFLHYRPNQRIKVNLIKEEEFNCEKSLGLEEGLSSLSSESSSDSEQVEEAERESGGSLSFDTDTEDDVEDENCRLQSAIENNNRCAKKRLGFSYFGSSRRTMLFLIFAIICLFITFRKSPLQLSPSMLQNTSYADLLSVGEDFEAAAYNFTQWSVRSISYLTKVIFTSKSELAICQFANLTALDQNKLTDLAHYVGFGAKQIEITPLAVGENEIQGQAEEVAASLGENEIHSLREDFSERSGSIIENIAEERVKEKAQLVELQDFYDIERGDVDDLLKEEANFMAVPENDVTDDKEEKREEKVTDKFSEVLSEAEHAEADFQDMVEYEGQDKLTASPVAEIPLDEQDTVESSAIVEKIETDSGSETLMQPMRLKEVSSQDTEPFTSLITASAVAEIPVDEQDTVESSAIVEKIETDSGSEILMQPMRLKEVSSQDTETFTSLISGNKLSIYIFLVASLFALAVLSFLSFRYLMHRKKSAANTNVLKELSGDGKVVMGSVIASSDDHAYSKEFGVAGEECESSEVSSTEPNSLPYGKQRWEKQERQIQSSERKMRRDSLVSNCSESASYGSFTAYEKLSKKHRSGDGDTLTPVRRSSRINKHITSP